MLLSNPFTTPYLQLIAVLIVAAALFFGSLYFNHCIDEQENGPDPTPVEYLVVIGVAYTLFAVLLVSWLAFLVAAVAFAISGLPMLWGARRRESWRRARDEAEQARAAEAQRQALIRRGGGDDAA